MCGVWRLKEAEARERRSQKEAEERETVDEKYSRLIAYKRRRIKEKENAREKEWLGRIMGTRMKLREATLMCMGISIQQNYPSF